MIAKILFFAFSLIGTGAAINSFSPPFWSSNKKNVELVSFREEKNQLSLKGTVRNEDGHALSKVTIELIYKKTKEKFVAISDKSGNFHFVSKQGELNPFSLPTGKFSALVYEQSDSSDYQNLSCKASFRKTGNYNIQITLNKIMWVLIEDEN